jgi:hypothetical protein
VAVAAVHHKRVQMAVLLLHPVVKVVMDHHPQFQGLR